MPKDHPLHRPRHGGRQQTARVSALVFFCVPLLLLVVGVRAPEFENRKLASFPTPADGWGFLTGFDKWATDHLPLRDAAVQAEDSISRGVFGEPPQFGQKHDTGPVQQVPPTGEAVPEEGKPPVRTFPHVIEGKDGWLYFGEDALNPCYPDRPLDEVVDSLNRLRRVVESSGRKFVLVTPPNKSTMVPEYLPSPLVGGSCMRKATDEFWKRIGEAKAFDFRPALVEAAKYKGGPVFSKTDTHWNQEMGVLFAKTLAELAQPGVTGPWRITQSRVVEVTPDLPVLLGRHEKTSVQIYDIKPNGDKTRSLGIDNSFREPQHLTQPKIPGTVSGTVGLIGDSFTYNFAFYVRAGFSDLRAVHSDTAATDPQRVADMLVDRDVVLFEAVERTLVGGANAMLSPKAIDTIAAELAKHPR